LTLRVRSGLVAFEVALALVLLTGCGLLTRSVIRLQHTDPGIETEKLAIVQVRLLPSYDQDEERAGFFSELRQRLEALPGVVSASFVPDPPMGFNQWAPTLWRETDPIEEPFGWANAHTVGLDYFRTLGIPVVRGRVFTETDHAQGPPVVVLSQELADTLWPGEDPLGKRLDASGLREGPWITVVGIVGDIRQRSLASRLSRDLYLPYDQAAVSGGQFMAIRTAGDPLVLAEVFRRTVWDLDDDVPIPEITTMEARVDATLRLPRFRTLLLAFFAGAALILAGAGIYGTLLYTTGKRTPEVGIRMALGAEARDVMGLVVRQGFAPVLVGLGLGLAGSLFATRVLESVLFDVAANDPATFVMVTVGLSFVSFLACLVPARKASRVDPQEALRAD
jgi:putative ABC transport system permease protein